MSAGLKITNRDRIFMLFAPSVIIVIAFFFLVAKPVATETASLRQRAAELGPSESIVAERPTLEGKLAKAKEDLSAVETESAESQKTALIALEPAERMRTLRELFHRHGGDVSSSSLADAELQFGQSLPECVSLIKRVTGVAPHHWSFEIEADYAGMGAALDELSEQPCVIDSLSMRPDDNGSSSCAWRLALWM